MLSPIDIELKEFKKSVRGYNEQEVTRFMEEVKSDYEKLHKENMELKLTVEHMTEQLSSYKNLESSIKDTLIVAQKTAEDVQHNAKREKELIVEEAKSNAKNIINIANNEVIKMQNQYEEIRKEFVLFKNKMSTLMSEISTKGDVLEQKFEKTQRIPVITEEMLSKVSLEQKKLD